MVSFDNGGFYSALIYFMAKKYKTYKIHCGKCSSYVLTYHKYGAGKGIIRLYLANIASPDVLTEKIHGPFSSVKEVPNLACPACGEILGVPAVGKGNKWVYRMRQGYFHRQLEK